MSERVSGAWPSRAAGPRYLYWAGDALYLNLTSRCSNGCGFCLRGFTWEVFGADLDLRPAAEPDAGQLTEALELVFLDRAPEEVVFAGLGEPTLRFDVVVRVTDWLRARRVPSRLNTNGQAALLNPRRDVVAELAAAGLRAASVSLNAHDEPTYDLLCRPTFDRSFRAVTGFIRGVVEAGLEVTATVVDVPEVDQEAAAALAARLGARFRVRPLVRPPSAASEPSGPPVSAPLSVPAGVATADEVLG